MDERINAIYARVNSATSGPWEIGDPWATDNPEYDRNGKYTGQNGTHCMYCRFGPPVKYNGITHIHRRPKPQYPNHMITRGDGPGDITANYEFNAGGILRAEDTEFIAHARDDVPWMLDQLADAHREILRLQSQLTALQDD